MEPATARVISPSNMCDYIDLMPFGGACHCEKYVIGKLGSGYPLIYVRSEGRRSIRLMNCYEDRRSARRSNAPLRWTLRY